MSRPKKPRFDAYDVEYASHKHRCGPFLILEVVKHGTNGTQYIVRNESRQEFVLPVKHWRLEPVRKGAKEDG